MRFLPTAVVSEVSPVKLAATLFAFERIWWLIPVGGLTARAAVADSHGAVTGDHIGISHIW